jgi:phosphatidylglycerophosphatase C
MEVSDPRRRQSSSSAPPAIPAHPRVGAQELVSRLRELGGGPEHALAFDGDGTLWSGDVGEDMFNAALEQRLLKHEALGALQRVGAEHNIPLEADPNDMARSLFAGYQRGVLAEPLICEVMAWCFAGWSYADLVCIAERTLEQAALAQRLFTPLARVLSWARENQLRTVVISASPDFVVAAAARHWGFAPQELAAARAAQNDEGVLRDHMECPVPYASSKVDEARRLLGGRELLAAFGDNSFDLELLRSSRVPIATRPKPALSRRLGELSAVLELVDEI